MWPMVTTVLLITFKDHLSHLINRTINAKFPGGIELSIPQETSYETNNPQEAVKKSEEIIKQQKEEIEKQDLTHDQLVMHISRQNIVIDFERIYNLIFKSQIDLLWHFQNTKQVGLNQSTIEKYFQTLQAASPTIYANWTWQDYINFLITRSLIVMNQENGNFIITDYGSAFLEYLAAMNYKKVAML
jgi:hypothetical protein